MKRYICLLTLSALLTPAGCGGPCTPGKSVPCTCASGAAGAQVCQEDQTYSACVCSGSTGDSKTGADSTNSTFDGGGLPVDGGALPPGGKRAFVTSSSYPANLESLVSSAVSGLHAGDLLCEQAAQGAMLGGTWKAWISGTTSVGSPVNAIDRMADVGPWYRLDGVKVFNNRANLGTTPLAELAIDERGTYTSDWVWTGTVAGGSLSGSTCYGWSSTSSYEGGQVGLSTDTDSSWTDAGSDACSGTARLYCFEQ